VALVHRCCGGASTSLDRFANGHSAVGFTQACVQAIYCVVTDSYNKFLSKMLIWYMFSLLTLFGNFFARKYLAGDADKKKKKKKKSA
jgi:GNS1/SUR4 family